MALLETAELVETPRPTGVAPELSPSPPGGEAPMPSMPVTVRESLKLSSSQSQDSVGQRRIPIVDVSFSPCHPPRGALGGRRRVLLASCTAWPRWSWFFSWLFSPGARDVGASLVVDEPWRVGESGDVSDGHTNQGFFDGSGRSRHPEGKELKVLIVSDSFESLSSIDRQRLVHVALKE
eukprot:g104.t1